MEKPTRKYTGWLVLAAVLVLVFVLAGLIWFEPVQMISVSPEEVRYIHDFDRTCGIQVDITDRTQIQHIVENLSGIVFQREKIAAGFGLSHDLAFYDENNKVIAQFVVQTTDQVKRGMFFYIDKTNSIDSAYLDKIIEEEYRRLRN